MQKPKLYRIFNKIFQATNRAEAAVTDTQTHTHAAYSRIDRVKAQLVKTDR